MENTGLLVFNKKEELIGTIDNGTGSDFEPDETGSFYFTEAQWVREINGEESLTLIMPADHEGAENVVNGNKVGFFDQEGIFHLFEFADTDEEHEEEQFKTVYCEHVYYELIDAERIGDIRPQNRSAEYVLQQALTNTNWSVGEVANLGNNSTNFYRENPLSAVQKIVEVWGGQLRWRVETDGQKITGRYVDLLYRVGDERGKAFIYGDNVESIQRNIDDTDVKTALYAYGKGEETEGGVMVAV
ncbi:phage tail spike protein [Thalassobacillus sp. C254]|uniref:phage tail spike protein n=1 Tax=Thalassobacillus sp. C254 TaxID=1225341 RepID=UPI0006D0FDF6|nr:phage tail spike protein [Thalassobacillus sp. C254]